MKNTMSVNSDLIMSGYQDEAFDNYQVDALVGHFISNSVKDSDEVEVYFYSLDTDDNLIRTDKYEKSSLYAVIKTVRDFDPISQ
jgi:hypothetical protein